MKRRVVKVARVRIMDAVVGDIVNKDPDSEDGWFQVTSVNQLFSGDLQLTDATAQEAISGGYCDIVGVQFVSEVDVPDQPELALPSSGRGDEEADEGEASDDANNDESRENGEAPAAAAPAEAEEAPAKPKGLREMLHQQTVN